MAAAKGEQKYKGWIDATVTIAREEGIAALWKGIVPRLARIAPGQAITWMVVTRIETWFEQRAMQQQRGGASF
jgi:solute carrier family 25 citrate transporter 1